MFWRYAVTIDGTWNTTSKTPLGKQKGTLVLKSEGSELSGSSSSQWGTDEFTGGTVDSNNFEFTVKSKSPVGPLKITYKGTFDGDKMSGQASAKPLGVKTNFEATRE
jgi:hypothetical protein